MRAQGRTSLCAAGLCSGPLPRLLCQIVLSDSRRNRDTQNPRVAAGSPAAVAEHCRSVVVEHGGLDECFRVVRCCGEVKCEHGV